MSTSIIEGSLLDSDAKYIVHQTNCISYGASGLAEFIFRKFPYADIYKERKINGNWHLPGNIYISGGGANRFIINAMGQFLPGKPASNTVAGLLIKETAEVRVKYFSKCLSSIACINDLSSIDFPWRIGCGLAGGDWDQYYKMIDSFATKVSTVRVRIVKRPEDN